MGLKPPNKASPSAETIAWWGRNVIECCHRNCYKYVFRTVMGSDSKHRHAFVAENLTFSVWHMSSTSSCLSNLGVYQVVGGVIVHESDNGPYCSQSLKLPGPTT